MNIRTLARITLPRICAFALVTAALVAAALPARAEAKPRLGLGGGLGDPTGPSLKLFLHPQHALQLDMGWAPMHHGDGIVHANYLFHIKPFVSNEVVDFGIYFGVGAGFAFWATHRGYYGRHGYGYYGNGRNCYDSGPDPKRCDGYGRHRAGIAMIVRAPFGIYLHWQKLPIDSVLEGGWSPYVVYPDLAHGDLSAKVRYYF